MNEIERQNNWKKAVEKAWEDHELGTYRNAALVITHNSGKKIDHTVLHDMRVYGKVPRMETVCQWADGIGEPRAKWLVLAGFERPPAEQIANGVVRVGDVITYLRSASPKLSKEDLEVIAETVEEIKEQIEKEESENPPE